MTNKSIVDSEDIVVKGPCAIVAYARRSNSNIPAKDYIESLERPDRAKLAKLFRTMVDVGKIYNPERFRKLGGRTGRIYEFKVHPKVRVLCFQQGKTWWLTHGFDKETGSTPPRQIRRAESIMNEHISLLQE